MTASTTCATDCSRQHRPGLLTPAHVPVDPATEIVRAA